MKTERRRLRYRDAMLSVSGILLFLIIWEALVMLNLVDSRKLCGVLEVFKLFIVKLSDPNPDGAILTVNICPVCKWF